MSGTETARRQVVQCRNGPPPHYIYIYISFFVYVYILYIYIYTGYSSMFSHASLPFLPCCHRTKQKYKCLQVNKFFQIKFVLYLRVYLSINIEPRYKYNNSLIFFIFLLTFLPKNSNVYFFWHAINFNKCVRVIIIRINISHILM